jgi:sodium-dependent dicarboxylate transporter 2/3/5
VTELVAERRHALGPMRGGERLTFLIFGATALAWVMREPKTIGSITIPGLTSLLPSVTDTTIAITAAVLLFIVQGRDARGKTRPLLTWREAQLIPWDVLLLFGGGLSLAAAMESTGLAAQLGDWLQVLKGAPTLAIYAGVALMTLILSELASNTATATMMMPLAAALAQSIGQPPLVMMCIAAFAASTGFALPIATPPNTIVFGSGFVTVRQMARVGVILDALALLTILTAISLLAARVLQ